MSLPPILSPYASLSQDQGDDAGETETEAALAEEDEKELIRLSSVWKEYTDPATGNKYFHDAVNNVSAGTAHALCRDRDR